MRTILAVGAALALGACASSSGVIQSGPDTYRLGATAITSFGGEATAKSSAYKQANEFCAKQGKRAELTNQQSDAQFTSASVDITFRCIP